MYTKMLAEHLRLTRQISLLDKQIAQLPEGSISSAKNGTRYKWYHCHDNSVTYIPKKQHILAEKLALKKYLSALQSDMKKEQRAIQFYLRYHAKDEKAMQMLDSPAYQSLLRPSFLPVSREIENWIKEAFQQNTQYPEKLVHKSCSGHILRSKSESMIDMLLFVNQIPFRYECALQLGEATIYPDFTIRHPVSGKFYYWEHFGMMDDDIYAQKAFSKQHLYIQNGIVPSQNLIMTFETAVMPLGSDLVESIIKQYFK